MGGGPRANSATGVFSGAPYRATKRGKGALKWAGGRVRKLRLCSSMGLPMGPRSARGVRCSYGATTRERCTGIGGGPRASSATEAFGGAPYGATKRARGALKWAGAPREHCHWGIRRSSLWGHEAREECAEMLGEPRANSATGAVSGSPHGATKRARGAL